MRTALVIAAALALAACATNGQPGPPGAHFDQLAASCAQRGGSLVPNFDRGGGVGAGYTCTGGALADARHAGHSREVR